eukprot:scaffold4902_cov115-Cylindrotheca_fusiformis.AAC.10
MFIQYWRRWPAGKPWNGRRQQFVCQRKRYCLLPTADLKRSILGQKKNLRAGRIVECHDVKTSTRSNVITPVGYEVDVDEEPFM